MLDYIIKDIAAVFRYLPYGIVAGIIVAILLSAINDFRVRHHRKPAAVAAITSYFMYLVIVLFITFLSREGGTRNGVDLQLLSTWGINSRNNAYVVENVLLFVPYGFVCAWAVKSARKFLLCTLYGFLTSLGIETLQLVTQRGYFQVDDILTNVLGTVIGYCFFRCILNEEKADTQKTRFIYVILSTVILAAMIWSVVTYYNDSSRQADGLSLKVSGWLVDKTDYWLELSLSGEDRAAVVRFVNPLLRKLAHSSEYAALAVVIGFGCQMIKRRRAGVVNSFYAVLICGVIALGDELLQQFVFGMRGHAADVAANLCGALGGSCIYVFLSGLFGYISGGEGGDGGKGRLTEGTDGRAARQPGHSAGHSGS